MSTLHSAQREFAARLAGDESFRELVERDPRAALAELGLDEEPGLVPDEVTLPTREELDAAFVRAETGTPDDDDDDDDDDQGDDDDEGESPAKHIGPPQNAGLKPAGR